LSLSRRRLGGLGERPWRGVGTCGWVGGRGRNDERTPMGRGRKHSTIDRLVLLRRRHGTRQPGQQGERIHVERVRADDLSELPHQPELILPKR